MASELLFSGGVLRWENWSFRATVEVLPTNVLRMSITAPDGALQLRRPDALGPLPMEGATALVFEMHDAGEVNFFENFVVGLYRDDTAPTPITQVNPQPYATAVGGGWWRIVIPAAALGATSGTITRAQIQVATDVATVFDIRAFTIDGVFSTPPPPPPTGVGKIIALGTNVSRTPQGGTLLANVRVIASSTGSFSVSVQVGGLAPVLSEPVTITGGTDWVFPIGVSIPLDMPLGVTEVLLLLFTGEAAINSLRMTTIIDPAIVPPPPPITRGNIDSILLPDTRQGETLIARITARNVGDIPGVFTATVIITGLPAVASAPITLAAGATADFIVSIPIPLDMPIGVVESFGELAVSGTLVDAVRTTMEVLDKSAPPPPPPPPPPGEEGGLSGTALGVLAALGVGGAFLIGAIFAHGGKDRDAAERARRARERERAGR